MTFSPRIVSTAMLSLLSYRAARGFAVRFQPSALFLHQHRQQQQQQHVSTRAHVSTQRNLCWTPCYLHNNHKSKLFSTKTAGGSETKKEDTDADADADAGCVPMTLLAGFLGSGKTTTLQNLLTNNDGLKVGIIVNDVASINIDSKLLSNPNFSSEETIELQNGCACCSLADELLTSVEQLTRGGTRELDAIVVELSGVADPVAVKSNWEQAELSNHPATRMAKVDKVVTLVDSSTFGTDWMTWDTSGDRDGWVDEVSPCGASRKVPELLAEQVEAADVLVINKVDLAGKEQVAVATNLAKGLNGKAGIFEAEFGKISVKEILQKKKAVEKAVEANDSCSDPGCTSKSHDHDHSHGHGHDDDNEEKDSSCSDPTCTDESHSHSHSHSEHEASDCSDPGCTDPSHNHEEEACSDADCTDETHSHSHSHDHASPATATSMENLGITNFVYKSDRPFNPTRLLTILNKWPVPVKDDLDLGQIAEAAQEGYNIDGRGEKSAFVGVLRSKGFCWMAPSRWTGANDDIWRHNTAMFWSHAGKHFGISTAGKWWGTITKEEMKDYFTTNEKEYERILREDFVSEEFGDRRQEIVFIGANIDEDVITKELDACLCSDEEMAVYRKELGNLFEPANNGGPSLFDVGGTGQMN